MNNKLFLVKIKDIRLKPLFSKFKKPYVWAMGKNLGQITILVEIETEEGIIGYGETATAFASPEAIYSILAIRDNTVPPTINLSEPDEGCDLNYSANNASEVVDIIRLFTNYKKKEVYNFVLKIRQKT